MSTPRATYQRICQRIRHNVKVRNSNKFKVALRELHEKLAAEPNITKLAPKEAYENLIQIYEEGKPKGINCLGFFYCVLACVHKRYALDSNNNETYTKAREMFSKSIQEGLELSDSIDDVYYAQQIGVFSIHDSLTAEVGIPYVQDLEGMINSCINPKGPCACLGHYYKGMGLVKWKRYHEALPSLQTSLNISSTSNPTIRLSYQYVSTHQINLAIGMVQDQLENHKLAIATFDKIIGNYDKDDENSLREGILAAFHRGNSLWKLRKFKEASKGLESFCNFVQTNQYTMENFENFEGFYKMAQAILAKMHHLDDTNRGLMTLQDDPDRQETYAGVSGAFEAGMEHFYKDDYERALVIFEHCLEVKLEVFDGRLPRPDFRNIHIPIGYCYENLNMYQEAIEHLTMAEDSMLKESNAINGMLHKITEKLAICYGQLNYHQESLHFWKKASGISLEGSIQVTDKMATVTYNIGNVLMRLGYHDEALKIFHKYLRMEKSEETSGLQKYLCMEKMSKCYMKMHKYKKALECADRCEKFLKNNESDMSWFMPAFKELKGRCLLGLNQHKEAMEYFNQAKDVFQDFKEGNSDQFFPNQTHHYMLRTFMDQPNCMISKYHVPEHPSGISVIRLVMYQTICIAREMRSDDDEIREQFYDAMYNQAVL